MRLIRIDEYIETCYAPCSKPTKRTVIKLIKEGEILGKKQGKFYYIDIEKELLRTGNPLVDRVFGTIE